MEYKNDILSTSLLKLHGDFKSQVNYLLQNVRLSRNDVENLTWLFSDLEQSLQRVWPGCIVMPFGSIVTGLGIQTSDADCYVSIPDHLKIAGEKYVMQAKHALMRFSVNFKELFAITNAKVPIVKCFHVPTESHCDISFKSISGVRNSKLIACLLQSNPNALNLAVLIKYWSKVHGITGTNLLPNYALTMMVIFYLQQINVLPSVIQLQRNTEAIMVDDWNTSFNEDFNFKSMNNLSLYKLLGGFFEYYSTFNFKENIVSPYLGRPLSAELFKDVKMVPNQFALYKKNVISKVYKPLNVNGIMCIQDPFDHSRNVSGAVYLRLAVNFFLHLKYATEMYKGCTENDFLEGLLSKSLAPITLQSTNKKKSKVHKTGQGKIKKQTKRNSYNHSSFQSLFIEINKLMKNNTK